MRKAQPRPSVTRWCTSISVSWMFSLRRRNKMPDRQRRLLYRNSWNEVRTLLTANRHDDRALKTILGKMHGDAAPPDSVEVFC